MRKGTSAAGPAAAGLAAGGMVMPGEVCVGAAATALAMAPTLAAQPAPAAMAPPARVTNSRRFIVWASGGVPQRCKNALTTGLRWEQSLDCGTVKPHTVRALRTVLRYVLPRTSSH